MSPLFDRSRLPSAPIHLGPALALGLAWLTGCAPPDVTDAAGGTGSALINGIETSARPEIGILGTLSQGRCTATLILPDIALTAAHCFGYSNDPPPPDPNVPPDQRGDYFHFRDASGVAQHNPVLRWNIFGPHVAPVGELLFAEDLPAGWGNNDIAIMQLRDRVPPEQAQPAAIADVQPLSGERVSDVSYGSTSRETGAGFGKKRYLSWGFRTDTAFMAPGDSGSPLFFGEHDGRGAIWGVGSGNEEGSDGLDKIANVTWFKEQILDVVQRWKGGDEDAVNRPGSDLRFVDVDDVNDPYACRRLCQADAACRSFTRVRPGVQAPTARCWLKMGRAGWVPDPDSTSGGSVTFESNVDFSGANLTSFDLPQEDPRICASECAQNASCAAFTYVKPWVQGPSPRCWLKSDVGVRIADTNTVSGVKRGLDVDVDRTGRDYTNFSSTTAPACQRSCATDARCKAFGFVASTKRCYLKSAVPGPGQRVGFTSSAKGGWEENVDRGGLDSRLIELPFNQGVPEICQAECEKDASCKAWAFVPRGMQVDNARCWLKGGYPAASYVPGVVSGLKGMGFF